MFFDSGTTASVIHAAGASAGWGQRGTEGTGRAGVDEGTHAGFYGGFEQVQRAADVGVDELLPRVGFDVRLMQGRGMQHRVDAVVHAGGNEGGIGDRADAIGER